MSENPKPKKPDWFGPIGPMDPGSRSPGEDLSSARQALNYLWIRLVIGLIGLVVVATVLALPKMWRSSPPDFLPVVRVSLLERLQCASLQRQARRLQDDGKTDEAVLTWRQAIANNPADREANRGLLRTLCAQAQPATQYLPHGLWQSQWLLRLTHTNQADLELVAHLCGRYEVDDLLLALLIPAEARLSDAAVADLLKGLFRLGQMDPFGAVWARHPNAGRADTELPLFHTAWQVGWGPVGEIAAAKTHLESAKDRSESRVLAHQLQLFISDAMGDPDGYAQSLKLLGDLHADRPLDHVRYWRMLLASGRRDEAATLAWAYCSRGSSRHRRHRRHHRHRRRAWSRWRRSRHSNSSRRYHRGRRHRRRHRHRPGSRRIRARRCCRRTYRSPPRRHHHRRLPHTRPRC